MKTYSTFHYTRGDVTFRKLGFFARLFVLFTGTIRESYVASFRLTQQAIPAPDIETALEKARESHISSDVATDIVSVLSDGDGWHAGQ